MNPLERFPEVKLPDEPVSKRLRITAIALRTIFICILIAATLRVAMPQNETIWTVDDTTGDLLRLILGVVASIWLFLQLFQGPADAYGYRTWLYLGVTAIPVSIALLFVIW